MKYSPNIRNAIIAVEDARFFQHPGVDPWGILRALYVNLRTAGWSKAAAP